jgi:hypothetical protein
MKHTNGPKHEDKVEKDEAWRVVDLYTAPGEVEWEAEEPVARAVVRRISRRVF